MQQKYDFILFENYTDAIHHYKDILIIAKMLKHAGYSVAIINYCEESLYCNNDELTFLDFKNKYKRPNTEWNKQPRNKIHSLFSLLRFLYQQHKYASYFLKQNKGLAKNFYLGSYHLSMSSVFFTKSLANCNYYLWGLRSSRITNIKRKFLRNPIIGLKALQLRKLFKSKNNFNFFVSDNFIKQEFIDLGISKNKLVLRPERIIENQLSGNIQLLSEDFSLLTIGLMREDKRVELTIESIKQLNDNFNDVYLTIAGRGNEKYEKIIEKYIDNNKNIVRIDKFLDNDEFNSLIERSHFVVLCDKRQSSLITNGTMLESFILNRPIIAPNYLPYSYYINEYKIGLLFDPDDIESLKSQIIKAKQLGTKSFLPNLKEFQKTLLMDISTNKFVEDLKWSMNKKL